MLHPITTLPFFFLFMIEILQSVYTLLFICVILGSPADFVVTDKLRCRKANLIHAGFLHNHIKGCRIQISTGIIRHVFIVNRIDSYEQISKNIDMILKTINNSYSNIIVVSEKGGEQVIHLDDVICIETEKSSKLLVTEVSKTYYIVSKLSEMEKKLSDRGFVSVHRSCLANMKYIRKFNSDSLEFTSGKTVNMSRRKLPEVKEIFSKYVSKQMRANR